MENIEKDFRLRYSYVYTWKDAPNYEYPRHFHKGSSSLYIIQGQVEIFFETGRLLLLSQWDVFDVPKNIFHTAKVGQKGCKYLVWQEFEEDENF